MGVLTQGNTQALAQAYFNNKRVPAAVLAAMCIQDMFALQSPPAECMKAWDEEHNMARSRRWRTLRYAYLLLMVLAFSLEISTIFVSTQVSTQLATSSWSPSTRLLGNMSLVDFLVKEFELEYTMVRGHFMTGLLSFTIAQALRVRYALRKYKSLAISAMCCLMSCASGMVCYQNHHTVSYGGLLQLMMRNAELSLRFLCNNLHKRPMSIITLVCLLMTVLFALQGWFAPEFVDSRYAISDEK
mmetsp:Transcript_12207/g.28733  ORF Transcript_12207/g.28733 Transcript_12207/m.28733 type:complete len:243 (-) Transcript_12207:25-753(-)